MTSTAAAVLMDRLGLTEDELCAVLGVDPLTVIAGDLDDKPQLPILLALTGEAAERVGEDVLRRWLRATGPGGRPLDHLLATEYGAFEDDLATLTERGLVLRGGGPRVGARGRGPGGPGAPGGATGASGNAQDSASGGSASGGDASGGGTGDEGAGGGGAGDEGAGDERAGDEGAGAAGAGDGERGAEIDGDAPDREAGRRRAMTRPRVRRIAPDEAETLRAIRLRALADAPLAFGSTHAREAAYPPERWRDWAAASSAGGAQAFFFAIDATPGGPAGFASGAPVGLASGVIWEADTETAHLYAMWVAPEARGSGAGAALVDAVVAWAVEHGALRVRTEVTVGNDGAARLYERAGFHDTGERGPLGHSDARTALLERPLPR